MSESINCEFEALDESLMIHSVTRAGKSVKAEARVSAQVEIDGVKYSVNRVIKLSLKKSKK